MSTLFDMSNIGETYSTPIRNTNINIFIRRENNGVASIRFATATNVDLGIPESVRVYCRGTNDLSHRVLLYPLNLDMYAICPTEKYWIEHNGDLVLTLNPMRAWKIIPSM